MPREARLDIPGLVHHVICRGIEQREIFIDSKDYRFFLHTLARIAKEEEVDVYAFCLMPNHIHLLVKPKMSILATCMRRLLTSYALYFNKRYRRAGHLFQNRYKSSIVQTGAYFLELVRYIHLNPVRASIVSDTKSLAFYSYTGYAALMGHSTVPWVSVDDVLLCFAKDRGRARALLAKFMHEGLEKDQENGALGNYLKERIVAEGGAEDNDLSVIDHILGDSNFAAEVLKEYESRQSPEQRQAVLKTVLEKTAAYFSLSFDELCSGTKKRSISEARAAAVFLGAKRMGLSPKMLAEALGVKQSAVYEILRTRKGEKESRDIVLE